MVHLVVIANFKMGRFKKLVVVYLQLNKHARCYI